MPCSSIFCTPPRNRHPPGDSVLRVREHLLPDGHVALGDAGQRRSCRHLWQQDTRSVQGVTMRCRLSGLTNSTLVYEPKPKCGGEGVVVVGSQHKVVIYIKHHSICPSSELGLPQPLSRQRVCPSPPPQTIPYSPAGEGLGESQFRRLEKRHGTLPTLWVSANDYSCAHGAPINFGNLTPYLTYGHKLNNNQ
jgi:hypothetical protein